MDDTTKKLLKAAHCRNEILPSQRQTADVTTMSKFTERKLTYHMEIKKGIVKTSAVEYDKRWFRMRIAELKHCRLTTNGGCNTLSMFTERNLTYPMEIKKGSVKTSAVEYDRLWFVYCNGDCAMNFKRLRNVPSVSRNTIGNSELSVKKLWILNHLAGCVEETRLTC